MTRSLGTGLALIALLGAVTSAAAQVFAYLSLWHRAVSFRSAVLQLLGLLFLVGYIFLAKRY